MRVTGGNLTTELVGILNGRTCQSRITPSYKNLQVPLDVKNIMFVLSNVNYGMQFCNYRQNCFPGHGLYRKLRSYVAHTRSVYITHTLV